MASLLPCPFCGAGTTEIRENGKVWTGMKWSAPISVSVLHWCQDTPGPHRMIERIGKDEAQAVENWNMRYKMQKDRQTRPVETLDWDYPVGQKWLNSVLTFREKENKMDTVTIPRNEYEELLLATQKWLDALENAGVDNLSGCDYAKELFNEEEEK